MALSDCVKCWNTPCTCGWHDAETNSRPIGGFSDIGVGGTVPSGFTGNLYSGLGYKDGKSEKKDIGELTANEWNRLKVLMWTTFMEKCRMSRKRPTHIIVSESLYLHLFKAAIDKFIFRDTNYITLWDMRLISSPDISSNEFYFVC